jgi:hypothetical protein
MLSGASYKSLLTGILAFYGFILLFWINKAPNAEPRDFDSHAGIPPEPHPITPDQAVKNRTLGVCGGAHFVCNSQIDHTK